ncbi:hypothetical protein [Burkholderia cenocepacia]|uniref:Uncharacterized protein n=1 Tax=Burkholderia phage Magia TaxID=2767577 RepID=A0A873WKX5_9CAUD|nr:hypothetical protein [Burkholderia cenocepacia]YP_010668139.1 hypothetical protein PQC04_gp43 [Burkholderia phage Magia]MBJ9897372.1 hypothetical protein [Burkholderia cenocepacia]MBJ9913945.1 hypothetical protein [Burkholderia cenocepacia]QPB08725.1 hypothetical protein CPT_Magia_043 [Burkholderia phage Magia]
MNQSGMEHVVSRETLLFGARAKLHACAMNRTNPAWKDFYWTMLGWAARARREIAELNNVAPEQGVLF